MVWFWQTRQRSSEVMRVIRASSAGSAASGTASLATQVDASRASVAAASRRRTVGWPKMSGIGFLEALEQRLDLGRQHLGRQRADVLHADDAVLVDDEGFRDTIHAEVDTDAAFVVEQRRVVRIAEIGEPGVGVGALVLVVEAVDRHELFLRELDQHRVLLAAGDAP